MKNIIAKGAEAELIKEDKNLKKVRIIKNYRIKEIDNKIRKLRTRSERKLLEKSYSLIKVPKVFSHCDKKMTIDMEYLPGDKLSEHLDNYSKEKRKKLCKEIGKSLAILHNNNIIHGDLTTSNMLVEDNELYFIDFGLGFINDKPEHKAVDIHLMKQAFSSKHYKHFEEFWKEFLKGYKSKSDSFDKIILRLEKVESRGRYKSRV